MRSPVYGPTRAPRFVMVSRPDPYRPLWRKSDGTIDTDAYIAFYEEYLDKGTAGLVAAFVLEPIQGCGGPSFFPTILCRNCAPSAIATNSC